MTSHNAQSLIAKLERELTAERKARKEAQPVAFLYWTRFGNKLLSFNKYDDPAGDYTECIPLFASIDAAKEGG